MRTQVEEKFSNFFEKWMSQLQDLLQLLLIVSKTKTINSQEGAYASMINKLTSHHKEYYKCKWELAHEDILSFFSAPIWLTPFENAHLWVTGWKPSTAFRLVEKLKRGGSGTGLAALAGLTDEQAKKIEGLRAKIRAEEERVEREMERIQVATADRRTVEVVRRVVGGEEAAAKVVGGWLGGLEKVMKMGDCVRLKTLKGLLDILTPMQGVDFLASKAMVDIRVRELGKLERRRKLIL